MKRVAFVFRSTFMIVLGVLILIMTITFFWGTFGRAAPVVAIYFLVLVGYGYFKVRPLVQAWRASKQRQGGLETPSQDAQPLAFAKSPSTLPEKYRNLSLPFPEKPLKTSLIWALFWFAVNGIAVAVLVLVLAFVQEWRLWIDSQSTQATIVETNLDASSVAYEFQVPVDGKYQKVSDSQEVKASTLFHLRVGDQVTVRYLPSNPSISILEGSFPPSLLGLYLILGSSLPVILWGFLPFLVENSRRTLQWLRLQREGQQVPGLIVWRKLYKATAEEVDKCTIAFAFEARAPHGSWQVFVRTEETSPKLYGAVRVGSRVTVRYLPENPAVCEIASLDTEIIR